MNTALSLSSADHALIAKLPDKLKEDTRLWIDVMTTVCAAERPLAAIEAISGRFRGVRGFSVKTMIRKYYEVKKNKSWHCLVDRAKLPKDESDKLPEAFIEFWKSVCEQNQRKSKPAWRMLIANWKSGKPIPGYSEIPPAAIHGVPKGWTYGNLMRFAPKDFELAVARIGRSAAAPYRPLVHTTRVGLEVGQYLFFDDLEHDIKVNFLGVNRKAMRPLELSALDLFSACKIAWGMKPTIDDEGIKRKLKDYEMRFLLAYILTRIGYRPAGTTLCVEHGTAAISEETEKLLDEASDGAIQVARSGMEGAAALVYEGRGKGNFRFKAALESSHNLAHNELAALPGQMGKDRDHSPEELHGREKHNNALIKAMAFLPPERAMLIRSPFLEFNQFMQLAGEVYDKINARDWHELEGWVESGLVANEFRLGLDLPWMSVQRYLEAPDHERQAIKALIDRPGYAQARKLSPAEVWARGRERLIRLPGYLAPQIIGPENGVERKVGRNGLFEFQDSNIGPGTYRYLARAARPDGSEEQLVEGETYLTFCNPFESDVLYVCKAGEIKGAYVGACARWQSIRRDDVEALKRQMGAAAKEESRRLLPFQARHTEEMRRRTEDAKWNTAVLAGKPVTVEERAAHERIKAADGNLEDIFGTRSERKEVEEHNAAESADTLSEAVKDMDKMF
jgi:hypothetical protein